jgi:hypothetical protein
MSNEIKSDLGLDNSMVQVAEQTCRCQHERASGLPANAHTTLIQKLLPGIDRTSSLNLCCVLCSSSVADLCRLPRRVG